MLFPHHSSTLMLYAVVILSQPLLLVVSIRLAPHSEELVLGMETFLTIRNEKETIEREREKLSEKSYQGRDKLME